MNMPINVLFLCSKNSARSIMAEAILNSSGNEQIRGFSAGRFPRGAINPKASKVLGKTGLETDNLRSKSWDEYAGMDTTPMHIVITVCQTLESCEIPNFYGNLVRSHWPIEGLDPIDEGLSEEESVRVFSGAFDKLESCINAFLDLPFEQMDGFVLQEAVDRIWQSNVGKSALG
jgi:arsenate reductase (thioredoxin)